MTTFVLSYEKISPSYQRAKIHNFCVSEEKNVAVGHRGTDRCQQINGQQGDKKELQHAPALRRNRSAAVLRHEKDMSPQAEETVKRGLAGHRAVSQETLVAGDHRRCAEEERQDVRVGEWLYHLVRLDKERGGTLYTYLPHRLKHRRRPVSSHIPIKDRVSIDERPAVADQRSRFGDWEMDTIVGKDGKGAIVTLVERTSKKLVMAKSPKGKHAKSVAKLVVQLLRPFEHHVLSITTDNGTEFAEHKYIAKMMHTKVFFAHPYSSWEKGLVENTNKLIRQYIPNGTDFSSVSDDYILHVQSEINLRPRKLLNFYSPKHIFLLSLHNGVALGG